MPTGAAAGCRDKEAGAYHYQRHRPENDLLYRIVEHHYPEFTAYLAEQGAILPRCVQREFEAYLKCGRLEHGFLRVQYNNCHAEHLVAVRYLGIEVEDALELAEQTEILTLFERCLS